MPVTTQGSDPHACAELAGRIALVTGSSSGIGLAVAKELRAHGAAVILNGRDRSALDDAVREVRQSDDGGAGAVVDGVAADVTDADQVRALAATVTRDVGTVEILVNNAGRTHVADSMTLDTDTWKEMIDLNLTGPFVCSQAFAAGMADRRRGVIVNIGSIFGKVGSARRAPYCAAKHGLVGLTRTLAAEWGPLGIRVCIVNAGYVLTPMVQRYLDDGTLSQERLSDRIPVGRLASTVDIGRAVRFLASDEGGYANGAELNLDGGWLSNSGW